MDTFLGAINCPLQRVRRVGAARLFPCLPVHRAATLALAAKPPLSKPPFLFVCAWGARRDEHVSQSRKRNTTRTLNNLAAGSASTRWKAIIMSLPPSSLLTHCRCTRTTWSWFLIRCATPCRLIVRCHSWCCRCGRHACPHRFHCCHHRSHPPRRHPSPRSCSPMLPSSWPLSPPPSPLPHS